MGEEGEEEEVSGVDKGLSAEMILWWTTDRGDRSKEQEGTESLEIFFFYHNQAQGKR